MYQAVVNTASVCNGAAIYTLDIQFPRAALAEFLTHRVMSKNTSSTRAIPIKSHIAHIKANPYIPEWTLNQSGMQGQFATDMSTIDSANENLKIALNFIVDFVEFLGGDTKFGNLGIHKQDAGRYLEPFSFVTLRVTSTEWKNFFWLRCDEAAYRPIERIARLMQEAIEAAEPFELGAGEYHLPDITRVRDEEGVLHYYSPAGLELSLADAIELSMSLSAQQSFRKADESEQKTQSVIDKLFNGNKVHASPSEHLAMAIAQPWVDDLSKPVGEVFSSTPIGITHISRDGSLWSGNFRGWVQHRQLLPNHDGQLL